MYEVSDDEEAADGHLILSSYIVDIGVKLKGSAHCTVHSAHFRRPSSLYRQLQPIISPKRGSPTQPVNLTPDDLNTYFTSIGTRDKVMTQICQSGREPLSVRLPRVNASALNIVPVTLDHLQRILSSLPNKSSCVEGDIPLNVLKLTFEVTGRTLLRIINKSIATETVPPAWKSAIVIPVYKRNDPSSASNFRPITIVPAICKVMEKIVHQQLVQYLRDQCLFSIDQHGFMSNHSTSTALF